jgi:hypothetical protein
MATQKFEDNNKQGSNQRPGQQNQGQQNLGQKNNSATHNQQQKGTHQTGHDMKDHDSKQHDSKQTDWKNQDSKKQNMRGVDMSTGSEFNSDHNKRTESHSKDDPMDRSIPRRAGFDSDSGAQDDDGNIDRSEVSKQTGMDQTRGTKGATGKQAQSKGQEKSPRPGNESR